MGFLPAEAKITEINDGHVTVELEHQTFQIPRSSVAGNPQKGDTVQLIAVAPGRQQDSDQEVARAMLNRLLGEGASNA